MSDANSPDFAAATAVELTHERPGSWRYAATIHDGWDIGGIANGGYVLAMAARAMVDAAGRGPLSITAHYLSPGRPGPATIDVDEVRIGKRMATLSARVVGADDREIIRVLATFGARGDDAGSLLTIAPPADLPPFDECTRMEPFVTTGAAPGLPRRLGLRFRPGDEGFSIGRPTGRAEVAGWFSFAGQQPTVAIDVFGVLLAADAFVPPIFNSGLITPSWAPTLELTVHLRAEPAPGPLAARFRSDVVGSGLLGEDGELWDSTGLVVAQSRQLALLPRASLARSR